MKSPIIYSLSSVFCYLVCILSFCACSDDNSPLQETHNEKLNSILYEKTITLRETLEDVFVQYEVTDEMLGPYQTFVNMLLTLPVKYKVYAITYHTVSPTGSPVNASGVVYYPMSTIPKGVIEVTPVNKSKETCGTQRCTMAEILPAMLGYICLVPDLIGCGSTADLPISYLQHENVAIVSADFRQAATELISQKYRNSLSKESILFGYSLGGSGTMALARYYSQHPELGVTVSHIFAGGGAYNPFDVVKAQLAQSRSDYAIIPNILYSMNFYDNLELDFSEIFKGELLENYQQWCDGYLPIADLTKKLGNDVSNYLTDKLLTGVQTSEDFKSLRAALQKKVIPYDWVPKAKVHLFHSKYDYYVPTLCGDNMYLYLKDAGADVIYKLYEAEHVESGLLMEIDFAKFLLELR